MNINTALVSTSVPCQSFKQ